MPDLARKIIARVGVGAIALGFLSTVVIAGSALTLAVGYRDQVHDVRHTLYLRCLQRDAYDRASQEARSAQMRWLQDYVTAEQSNRFIDSELRARRVASASRAIDALGHALTTGAPRGCAIFK